MADVQTNLNNFYAAQSRIQSLTPDTLTGRSIYKFNNSSTSRIPIHVRTGSQSFGSPDERKRFQQIEFHGSGTVFCRVYVDGVYIMEASATMTEVPSKDRRIGIPIGTRGYVMDIEFCGDANIRAIEYTYSPMLATS